MSNARSRSAFAGIFASPTLVDVLGIFLTHPERDYYQRELVALTGSRLSQVQRDLRRLERAGLVSASRRGNRIYYRAAGGHPAFADLQRVFVKTVAVTDVLREALEPLRGGIEVAFIYGSMAGGSELAASDIDVFVVGNVPVRSVVASLSDAEVRLAREINATVCPHADLLRRIVAREPYMSSVLQGPKLWILGDESGLNRLTTESGSRGA
jgi:DNA-binding transcriptional ArsR family regulator